MSNGNDHPNFPPPPSEPPNNGGSKPESEQPTDEDLPDSVSDDASSGSDGPAPSGSGSSVPDDQAPPLGTPGDNPPSRPTVAPAASQQSQPPQYSGPGAQNDQSFGPGTGPGAQNDQSFGFGPQGGANGQGGPQSGPYPGAPSPSDQPQNGQYPNNQYQSPQQPNGGYPGAQPQGAQPQGGQQPGGQYSNAAYPGASNQPPYPGAQNQPGQYNSAQNQSGQYQTGSGPNAQQTGSGPSQAIPQPAPAPGFAGGQSTATRAENRPDKKKSKLPLFITLGAVALVIVLVLVGFFVVGSVNKNKYGPDKVAEDYVEALNKGDFAAAEKIAPSPRPEGTNLDLLQKEFTDSSSAKIEKAKVESSKTDGDKGTVVVSYELDGSPYNVELAAKKDGKQDLFFDKWTMKGPDLNVISLDVPGADGLAVNGKDYKAKSGTTSFAVYPGSYDFTIPKSKWISEASDTAKVNFPKAFAPGGQPNKGQVSPTTLNLELSPTGAFDKEVQKQVEKELKKCFDTKKFKPACKGMEKYDFGEVSVGGTKKTLNDAGKKNSGSYNIKKMPKVKPNISPDPTVGSFFTEQKGEFDFEAKSNRAGETFFSNGNAIDVNGEVKIEDDSITVKFW
jgi:hypothetical protein